MRQLKIIKQVTNRENSSIDKYLNEIAKIKLITAKEETDLAKRIHKGDLNARDRLINANQSQIDQKNKVYYDM
jgi:RNA polymerase primary sigma factor